VGVRAGLWIRGQRDWCKQANEALPCLW
jgi:hypothetical protein